ncbi:hypothetical protein [Clostridium perfringens]|uniref:hypothetical protein n=1 Tax=Clostridium perfringens TaxID=1502 RepID=UPI003F4227F2
MINIIEDWISIWINRIIGILFLIAGIYMVVTNNYNEIIIVMLSVFSLAYWWKN